MPIVKPFKGVLYNRSKVKNIGRVVAPPYDIIPAKMQEALYRSSPHNIIRLELGKKTPRDTGKNNRYTRARDAFNAWLKGGVLAQDGKDAFYLYSQTYRFDGKTIDRIGFLGALALGESGKGRVLPHEKTLRAPKEDRLNLMREVNANLSPIFILYDDPSHLIVRALRKVARAARPVVDVTDAEGVRNRVWRVDDARAVATIERVMRTAKTFIADGHHRFETATTYAGEAKRSNLSPETVKNAGRMMVYFVESDEKMLTVLPAHRLPKDIGSLSREAVLELLEPAFRITPAGSLQSMMTALRKGAASHTFGLYAGGGRYYVLKLKDPAVSDRVIKDKPRAWKRLDVAILHLFIFQYLLGISDHDDNVEFVKDPRETARLVDKGEFPLAFFLNPTKASQVKEIAKLGERMPRKATYFYPKPLTGLVIHKF